MASSAPSILSHERNLQGPSAATTLKYSFHGEIIISALLLLLFIAFILLLLRLYAKWLRQSFGMRSHRPSSVSFRDTPLTAGGLSKEIVEALPVFAYKRPSLSKAVECVVCLSNFRQDELCKLLPECQHVFHIDCIDMWFLSHTTCPLCRTVVDPSHCGKGQHDIVASSMSCFQDGVGERYEAISVVATRDASACDINGEIDDGEKQGDRRNRHALPQGHFSQHECHGVREQI